jgi:uncharacterized protein (DUF362 family)
MKRREFCRKVSIVGGTAMMTPLLNACQKVVPPTPVGEFDPVQAPTQVLIPTQAAQPTDTAVPDPTATQQPSQQPTSTPLTDLTGDTATVALVKTTNRSEGVRRAIELLGHNPVNGRPVLLKPNFNSADLAPASTHPDVFQSLLLALQGMGAKRITVGERSGMGNTYQVMQQIGVFDLADAFGFETAVFDELAPADWVVRSDSDFHWSDGFAVPKMLLDAECVVQTCNLKTHRYGGHFTLSLKNSVGFAAKTRGRGGYNYMDELHSSAYQRQMIAEINTAYTPALVVIDGVEAFVNGGPASGKLVQPEVVLAGTDRIALDVVGVAILRSFGTTPEVSQGPIFEQTQIARAVELGLGVDSPTKIQFVTGDPESQAYTDRISAWL